MKKDEVEVAQVEKKKKRKKKPQEIWATLDKENIDVERIWDEDERISINRSGISRKIN